MGRFDTTQSYLSGFGQGQSLVNHAVDDANSTMGQVHAQQQFGLQQQHFDYLKQQAAQERQDRYFEAQTIGNLAKTLVKQNPSGQRIDGPTGTMVPDTNNPVDEDTLRTIDYAMKNGNVDALKYMVPFVKDSIHRAKMIETAKNLSKNFLTPADPGAQAALAAYTEAGHPEHIIDYHFRQAAENQHEQQLAETKDREERIAAHQQQQMVDAATAKDLVDQQQERVAGQLASRTAPDGTPYGDAQQYDLLKNMDPKSTFSIAHQVAAKALGLGKQPAEPQTEPRTLHLPIGGDIANEKVVSVTGSKGGTLEWNEHDPIVQEFMDLAKQVQPAQDQGAYDAPGLSMFGNKESDQQYAARVQSKAKALAQQAGWKIGGGKQAGSPGGVNGDMLDQLINEALQHP